MNSGGYSVNSNGTFVNAVDGSLAKQTARVGHWSSEAESSSGRNSHNKETVLHNKTSMHLNDTNASKPHRNEEMNPSPTEEDAWIWTEAQPRRCGAREGRSGAGSELTSDLDRGRDGAGEIKTWAPLSSLARRSSRDRGRGRRSKRFAGGIEERGQTRHEPAKIYTRPLLLPSLRAA